MPGMHHRLQLPEILRYLGWHGVLALLGILGLVALFAIARPLSPDDVEVDIWHTWATQTGTTGAGFTMKDLLIAKQKRPAEEWLKMLGELVTREGGHFPIRTRVRRICVWDERDKIFAEWQAPEFDAHDLTWITQEIPLVDVDKGPVGRLEVSYKFYAANLENGLPSIAYLERQYVMVLLLVIVAALVLIVAVLVNIARLHERAGRLKSQQVTLELAHRMCHELRNGLWAFSLDSRKIGQLFRRVDEYFAAQPEALDAAASQIRLEPGQRRHLARAYLGALADRNADPRVDVLSYNDMAKDALQQIESFSRYLHLTVEELDHNLLGAGGQWNPQPLCLRDVWRETCGLLEMRFRSAGITHVEQFLTDQDRVVADRQTLLHVFINLAKNGIEAMCEQPGRRELVWSVVDTGDQVRCAVTSFGAPIPAEDLPRVFQPGFSTKQGAGRGTGLALVWQSVERMRATIGVTSDAQAGTCFTLAFEKATDMQSTSTQQQNDVARDT